MKKYLLLLIVLPFLLSGCLQNKFEKIRVNNPYEIVKGTTTLSYYDTVDNIRIDGFKILDLTCDNILGLLDKNENRIIMNDGIIRLIHIVDKDILTYNDISVGDDIEKLNDTFNKIHIDKDVYTVILDNSIEQDYANPDKEDTWIWIHYFTDGLKITAIQIYDVKYGRDLM